MIALSRWTALVFGWMAALLAALPAEEPARKAAENRPPWQRYLRGDDEKQADRKLVRLVEYMEAGKYTEALKVAEELAALRQKVQGADHWEAVRDRWMAVALRRVVEQKEDTRKEYAGINALADQVDALKSRGRYAEAQPLVEKLLAIRLKVLGEEHPHTAACYFNLADNLHAQGKYAEADVLNRKALALRLKLLGEENPDTANSYNNLASNLKAQGKYGEAEENNRRALTIYRKVLGEEHPHTATGYANQASILAEQGKYAEAEKDNRKALAIRLRVLGKEDVGTANSYSNLGLNLYAQGKHTQAEEAYYLALAICRKALGDEHPYTVITYHNLASNWCAQGKYAVAEEGNRKALAVFRKVLGDRHPHTATGYHALTGALSAQGKYAEAVQCNERALTIRREILGKEHPHTLLSYSQLASALDAHGKHTEAEEIHREVLALRRKVFGAEHPVTATTYSKLAQNLNAQGRYSEAEENNRQALTIQRKQLGLAHLETATSYNHLACDLYDQGKYDEAEKHWRIAAEIFGRSRLALAGSGLERAAITSENSPLPPLAAVLARNQKPEEAWQRFEESLARGTWDDLTARRRPAALRTRQAQLLARVDRLNKLLELPAASPQTDRSGNSRREQLLTQMRQTLDELADFTRQLEKTFGPVAGEVFSLEKIQAALPADTALLGWLDLSSQERAKNPNGEHWAVLLRSSGEPVWVRLPGSGDGDAWTEADTRLPGELRTALQSPRGPWQEAAKRLRQQRLQPLVKHLKGVRHLIVLPSPALAGVPVEVFAEDYTISYAHSGTLYAHLRRQPAASGKGLFALADPAFDMPRRQEKPPPLPPGGVLVTGVMPGSNAALAGLRPNDVLLRYGDRELAAVADLQKALEANRSDKLVPVRVWRNGNPLSRPLFVQPGKLGAIFAQEPAPAALAEQRRFERRLMSRGSDEGKWNRLPGTQVEAASLQHLFDREPTRVLLRSEAGEQQLDELAQSGELGKYRYLHLATHGEVDNTFPLRSALILSRDHLPDDAQRTELLLSGRPIPDGRLTAEEVLQRWNLNCELVTLSACQSALGKYERGEGFVGFAQALVLCGSRSVCLSLWKVDDTATTLLMERFYQNLLGKRPGLSVPLPKARALAEARTWLRNLPREEAEQHLARLQKGLSRGKGPAVSPLAVTPSEANTGRARQDHPFAHPYYWAAFVLIGHSD